MRRVGRCVRRGTTCGGVRCHGCGGERKCRQRRSRHQQADGQFHLISSFVGDALGCNTRPVTNGPTGSYDSRNSSDLTAQALVAQCIIGTMAIAAPKVLVVDDDSTVREVVMRYLLREGYRVEESSDGADALERASPILPSSSCST